MASLNAIVWGDSSMSIVRANAALAASLLASTPLLAEPVEVEFDEATNLAAAVSPDGSEAILDIQGILWRVPMEGGEATQITEPELDPARPHWSPSGDLVALQAYQAGTFDIWTMSPDGSDLKQLTDAPWDEREPEVSPDGSSIAFVSDRSGTYDVWSIDIASGEMTQWTDSPGEEAYPTWSPDGEEIAFVVDRTEIRAVRRDGETRDLVSGIEGVAYAPSWTKGDAGGEISWIRSTPGKADLMVGEEVRLEGHDVFPFRVRWEDDGTAIFTADGGLMRLEPGADAPEEIPFTANMTIERPDFEITASEPAPEGSQPVKGIVTPALHPNGESIAFVALGDLWIMPIGGTPEKITDDAYYESDPAWSADGSRLAYISDRAGTLDIWVRDMESGEERAVTTAEGAELYPAWSPDGSRIVYQTESVYHSDTGGGTMIVDVESGESRRLVEDIFQPGRASWSADGSRVALAAVVPYTQRFREGTSQILVVDVESGEQSFYEPRENVSLTTRSDNGPVWSPDGSAMAFVMLGALHVVEVDDSGQPLGDPRRLVDGIADSPTWSGDSSTILFLQDGVMKTVGVEGGSVADVAMDLQWSPEEPPAPMTIHAGRLWDGASEEVRTDVDIVISNGRIDSVAPHDDAAHDETTVDAGDLTVVPGLIEAHTHQTWGNHTYGFGAKQGRLLLSMGITGTQSVGELAYRAVGDHEALASGNRVGPRFYYTGGPLDGSRIYYNAMRPVADAEQLDAELARAAALGYDTLKTYVRLKPEFMKIAADEAGAMGVATYSHFLAPGVYLGLSGTTHLGATERLDYSRIGSITGKTYSDVISLFSDGGMSVVTSFFAKHRSLFGENDIREDARVQALLPKSERDALEEAAENTDTPETSDSLARLLDNPETFAQIREAGGRVLAGTDSPLDFVAIGLHSNLRWLAEGPMTPFQILQTATSAPAEELGLSDELGTIEPGKIADLALVSGRPDETVEDLINVEMVVKGGRLYTIDELIEPFADAAANAGSAAGD